MRKDHSHSATLLARQYILATVGIFGWSLIFFVLCQSLALAQSSTYARLVGTITDPTGAVLPGVELSAMAKATNMTSEAISNDRGDYVIDKLIPGLYGVSAELPGFKRKVKVDIPLAVSQVARVDFNLEPGEMIETVVVTGYLPIINTDDAELGAVVDESRILDMPLKNRDLVKLAYLTPGASHQDSYVGASVMNPYGGFFPAFNGLYAFSNQITLDGSNNQSAMTMNPVVQATPETIQEFKVITNNYSAEYGRVGGAVISMLSKSGSNEIHGHAWYYFRDEAFDAADFFTNKTGGNKLPVNYQIFGGSIGGPVIKDRTFFHAHYERFIDDFEQIDFATVPSMALRTGDFREGGASGQNLQLYNPFDVVDGQRSLFDGNQIPRSLWNPIYNKVMELIPPPEPNVPGVSARNYSFPNTRNTRINKYSLQGDHHLASGDTLFGRFSWQNTPETSHGRSSQLRVGLPGAELHGIRRSRSERSRGWQTAIGWVNPMGSNLVTEFNASIWKTAWLVSEPLHRTNFADQLGYDDADRNPVFFPDGSRGPGNVPRINLEDYTGWGGASTTPLSDWGLGFKYTASWRRANHYFKFGFNHSRNLDVNFSQVAPHSGGGDYFNGFATRNADGSISGATFGDPWADFMLGLPRSTFGNNLGLANSYARFNQSHYNVFVNDDWKLGPNLTLNLGLRWEQPLPPYYEGSPDGSFSTDYYYCAIDYSQSQGRIDPVQMVPQGFDIPLWQGPTGLAVPFQNLSRGGCYEPRWSYFAPRFGLAWRMFGTNRTVLRLGAGLNYDQGFSLFQAQPLGPARGRFNVFAERGVETPTLFLGQRLGLPTELNTGEHSSGQFQELDWQEGRVYSYNLSIQHELFRGTKLEIGYVGNQGRHLRVTSSFNSALPEGYVVPLIEGSSVTLINDPITAGPRSWIMGDSSQRSWSGERARRPYPQIRPARLTRPDGNTNYNSLQAKLERRFQEGVALSLGYTWSKAMALNFNGNWIQSFTSKQYERHNLKAAMLHDRPEVFYASAIWELPFFRNGGGLSQTLLGGWKATTIVSLTSGSNYFIWYGRDPWDQGPNAALQPDRIADGNLGKGERSVDGWFDTNAFVPPVYDRSLCQGADICHEAARRALGNSAERPLRYDGAELVDISVHKEFAFGEEKSLDFRVDLFNAFNHAVFDAPFGNLASGAAGKVFGAASARQIQFGFRFSF